MTRTFGIFVLAVAIGAGGWLAWRGTQSRMPHPASAVFAPDSRSLAVRWTDGTITLRESHGGGLNSTLWAGRETMRAAAWSSDGRLFAAAFSAWDNTPGFVRVWNLSDGSEMATLQAYTASIHCLAFSPDGRRLATGGRDPGVRVWDLASQQLLLDLDSGRDLITCVAFSTDGALLAAGGYDNAARVWDAGSGGLLHTLLMDGHVTEVRFVRDDGELFVASRRGARAYSLPGGTVRAAWPGDATVCELSADASTLLVADSLRSRFHLRDYPSGRLLASVDQHGVVMESFRLGNGRQRLYECCRLPQRQGFAIVTYDIGDLASQAPRVVRTATVEAEASRIALSSDGNLLVVNAVVKDAVKVEHLTMTVYDTTSGEPLYEL